MESFFVEARGIYGSEFIINNPTAVCLKKDAGLADMLTLKFLGKTTEPISRIKLFVGGKNVFSGICDEEIYTERNNTEETTAVFRDLSALLRDNQLPPMVIKSPSSSSLSKAFCEDLGLKIISRENRAFNGEITIAKGDSVMDVLRAYSENMYTGQVYTNPQGEIYFDTFEGKSLSLPNIISSEAKRNSYNIVSEYIAINSISGAYSTRLKNSRAYGVKRTKLLNNEFPSENVEIKEKLRLEGFFIPQLNDYLVDKNGKKKTVEKLKCCYEKGSCYTDIRLSFLEY